MQLGGRKGIRPVKTWGDYGVGVAVSSVGVAPTGSSPISLLCAIMRNLLGFVEQRKKMGAEAPTVQEKRV